MGIQHSNRVIGIIRRTPKSTVTENTMHRELSEVLSNEYSVISEYDTTSLASTALSETEEIDKKSCACTFIFWGSFVGVCGVIGISRHTLL